MIPGIKIAALIGFAPTLLTMSPGAGALTSGVQNAAYSASIGATGGTLVTYAIISGSLPAGLSFNGTTGAITGTPTGFGGSSFTIRASDVSGTTTMATYTITVDRRVFNYVISSPATNVNLFTVAGNPAGGPGYQYIFTINAGVVIGSASTATRALQTGAFTAGALCKLINHGSIFGKEGLGGAADASGSPGGDAMGLNCDLSLDNTDGFIFGGGGGGGGGESYYSDAYGTIDGGTTSGGNGGKGQGFGNQSAAEAGAPGESGVAGAGGNGGAWGAAGSASGRAGYVVGAYVSGGAAGKAVDLGGHAVTWLGGNDATHVKGAVS
mgnify:CR=1 FL=1